jgi:ribose transport system permease protein
MDILGRIKRFASKREFASIVILTIIIILNYFLQKNFFALAVLQSNLLTFTPSILVGMGQAIVIFAGGIDLSIGAQISLVNVILATMLATREDPGTVLLAFGAGLGASILMGLANGFVTGYLNIAPIIGTFATGPIWFGLALFILPQPGGAIPTWVVRAFNWRLSFISTPLLIILFAVLIWLFIKNRPLGRYIYAVGSNEYSAYANGINVRRIKLFSYVLGSFFAYLAALAITFQAASGDARLGSAYTLTAVAAAVVGGIALKGGQGTILGAIIGALVLNMVINLIYFANIPSTYQEFMKGIIIILALATAVIYKRRETRRAT